MLLLRQFCLHRHGSVDRCLSVSRRLALYPDGTRLCDAHILVTTERSGNFVFVVWVSNNEGDGNQSDHRVIVTAVVKRQPRFYELNVIIMLCMLTTISFVTFFMDARDDLSSNIEITLTLILTAVAFRFSISGKLPTVSYMTVLDKYIMASFLCSP